MWTTHIYTKGGYEWEVLRIPFYHFFQQHHDAKVMNQTILPIDSITGLRFRIQDDVQGPFKFELDYIATTYDTQFRQFHNKGTIKILSQNRNEPFYFSLSITLGEGQRFRRLV